MEKLSYFPLAAALDTATCFRPSEAKALVPGENSSGENRALFMSLLSPFILGKEREQAGRVKGGNCLPNTEKEACRQLAEDDGVAAGTIPAKVRTNGLWLGLQGDIGDSLMIERAMVESAGPFSGWDLESCS